MSSSGTRNRRWCFTINNPSLDGADDPSVWLETLIGLEKVPWAVWQYERGNENSTLHVQGFVIFKNPMRKVGVRALNARAHWIIANGDNQSQMDYCRDETGVGESEDIPGGHPWQGEVGVMPASGRGGRSDLLEVQALLDSGASMSTVAENHFGSYVRYNRGFDRYRQIRQPPRTWQTFTKVIIGPPGVGKSRMALEEAGLEAYWLPRPNGPRVFWDGYDGQDNVVIDEFTGWMSRTYLCRLLDRYPLMVDTKGSSVPFRAKKIWITSNSRPEDWYPRIGLGPIVRRLSGDNGAAYSMDSEHALTLLELSMDPVAAEEDFLGRRWARASDRRHAM